MAPPTAGCDLESCIMNIIPRLRKLDRDHSARTEPLNYLATTFQIWLGSVRNALRRPNVIKPYNTNARSNFRRFSPWIFLPIFCIFCVFYGFAFALTAPYLILHFSIPIVALSLVAIWALPDSSHAPTGPLQLLFFIFFVGLVVWPNYLALSLKGLPWITLIRLTGFPLLLLLLICVSTSEEFRSSVANTLKTTPLLWKFFVAFAILQLISIGLSSNITASINKFIIAQVSWTAVFFISCYVFLKRGRAEIWGILFCLATLLVAAVGAYESVLGRVPWAGHVPSFLKIEDEAVQRILGGSMRFAIGVHRVQSVFTTSLGLAECIALSVPFFLHLIAARYPLAIRIAAMASLPFLFYVVLLTDSRLGVVGFLIAFMLYILLWGAVRWKSHKSSIFGPAVVLAYPVLFCGFVASTLFVGRIRNEVWGTGAHQASNEGRIRQYQEGFEKIAHNPFGYGIGQGAETLGTRNGAGVLTIDTYYILIALEYGVLGFVLYYGAIISAIYYAGRHIVSGASTTDRDTSLLVPATISLTSFFVIKSIFSNQDNHPIAFMLMGMMAALCFRATKYEGSRDRE